MKESAFEKDCIELLRQLENSYWPDKVDALSVRGLPDRVGCVNGTFCALEFKRDAASAKQTTGRIVLQKHTLHQIQKAGGFTAFVYPENWEKIYFEIVRISMGGNYVADDV